MNESWDELREKVRKYISGLTNEERLAFVSDIMEDYCEHCGRFDGDSKFGCQCWNDE